MDADALIKLTRAGAKEQVTAAFEVCIPGAVEREIVDDGTRLGYPDAPVVEANIAQGRLMVVSEARESGDAELLEQSLRGGYAAVVTDDAYLLTRLKALGVSATVPAAILLATGRRLHMAAPEVMELLDALSPFISEEEFVTYRLLLEGRYPRR